MENRKDAVINKRNLAQFAQRSCWFRERVYPATGRDVSRWLQAKHAHFYQGGIRIVRIVVFRRAGDGVNESLTPLKGEVRFVHFYLSGS